MNPVQKLLVEGENDRHVIANLASVKGLPMPKGCDIKKKFDQRFVTKQLTTPHPDLHTKKLLFFETFDVSSRIPPMYAVF